MTTQLTAGPQASSTGMGTGWYGAHIYYYEPDKDALILDGIRPLVQRLRPVVESVYLNRHWRQGPHLRLHVRTDAHTWASVVQPQLEDRIGAYLRAHPSTAVLDERAELPIHLLLAEREQQNGPLSPWYPDNSLQYLPYDSRLHVLGHQEVADLAPAQRMRTCHLAANAVEDLYDLNAVDMVRSFVEQHPDHPAT